MISKYLEAFFVSLTCFLVATSVIAKERALSLKEASANIERFLEDQEVEIDGATYKKCRYRKISDHGTLAGTFVEEDQEALSPSIFNLYESYSSYKVRSPDGEFLITICQKKEWGFWD